MAITLADLKASMPNSTTANAQKYLAGFNQAITNYDLSTPLRLAHFLAQTGHESGSMIYNKEIASGAAYEGRHDLGNTQPGDGMRFKGRGLIQITGRNNYKLYGDAVGVDFISNPILLEQPPYAVDSAGWFWKTHNLNPLADADDILHITKKINGGINGLDDRKHRLQIAKTVLHIIA